MTESEYIDYFERLARLHKAIRHSDDVPRFYYAHQDNRAELEKAVRSRLQLPALVIDSYYDEVDRTADNYRLRIQGGLSVLVRCRIEDPLDVRRAQGEARAIAQSFLSRMYDDCRLPMGSLFGRRIVPSVRYEGEPAEPIAGITAGWGYPFEWTVPIAVAVDPASWLDLSPDP